jgi:AraC-like DNA-binding protein
VISGAYQLWNTPLHPRFAQLPRWHVQRADQLARLGPVPLTVALLQGELADARIGRTGVVNGLLDALFTFVLRAVLEPGSAATAGFALAVQDPRIGRAVACLHEDCARAWTLEQLAAEVGLSRTVLAERFRQTLGDTPLNYLRTVRMQRAMRLLSETRQTLEQVAQAVGYQDAFGFSKVFKRTVGVPPREFRRRDAEERALPYRFEAA